MLKVIRCYKQAQVFSRQFCIGNILTNEEKKKPKRKVSESVELINLVDQHGKILGLKPKPESEKLARKLNLSLEKTDEPKYGTMYPAYKMVSAVDLLKNETRTSTAKALKKLPINSRISDNDLKIKIHTIRKWLAKNSEVHIAIAKNNENAAVMKLLFEKIKEEFIKDSRILNIRQSEDSFKFIILPPKKDSEQGKTKSEEIKTNND